MGAAEKRGSQRCGRLADAMRRHVTQAIIKFAALFCAESRPCEPTLIMETLQADHLPKPCVRTMRINRLFQHCATYGVATAADSRNHEQATIILMAIQVDGVGDHARRLRRMASGDRAAISMPVAPRSTARWAREHEPRRIFPIAAQAALGNHPKVAIKYAYETPDGNAFATSQCERLAAACGRDHGLSGGPVLPYNSATSQGVSIKQVMPRPRGTGRHIEAEAATRRLAIRRPCDPSRPRRH